MQNKSFLYRVSYLRAVDNTTEIYRRKYSVVTGKEAMNETTNVKRLFRSHLTYHGAVGLYNYDYADRKGKWRHREKFYFGR